MNAQSLPALWPSPTQPSYDLARCNLDCARGLPGSVQPDITKCLNWIDHAARTVSSEMGSYRSQFRKWPEKFNHSFANFQMQVMTTILQKDLGVHYRLETLECSDEEFYRDSANVFIHGIIQGQRGTCSSMPVLFAAVGRRLGFPIRLVRSKEHLFARWDDLSGERFQYRMHLAGIYLQSRRVLPELAKGNDARGDQAVQIPPILARDGGSRRIAQG
jgi:Transglutaminase-like superfamily